MAATDVITLAEAKDQLNIPRDNTASDAELAGYVAGASRACERYVGAVVHRTVVERFDGGRAQVLLTTLPVVEATEVKDTGAVVEAGGYTVAKSGVLSRVAGPSLMPFLPGVQTVEVTYTAGQVATLAEVAEALPHVRLAALIILQHMWETQRPAARGPFDQQGDDFDPRYAYSIPRRAQELLGIEQAEAWGFA